ncbi:MAG: DUF885 domain-containing protein [Candidatus Bathyarchaeia archaeon]
MKDEDSRFDQIAKEMFETFLSRDPVLATSLGIHQYDHLLPDGTLQAKFEDIEVIKKFLSKFEEFTGEELTEDRLFDRDLAIDSLRLALFFEEGLRLWSSSPEAPDTVGTSLFLLLAREFAPLEARLRSISGRVKAIPRFLRESKERLLDPVELWTRLSLQAARGLPHLLKEIVKTAQEAGFEYARDLERDSEEAVAAVSEYAGWLSDKVIPRARKDFAIGKEKLDMILELRGLGLNSDQILEFAYSALKREKDRLRELASEVKPGASVEEVKRLVKSHHPKTFQDVLEAYRRSIEESKRFILERGAFRVPENEAVIVKETPVYMRSLVSTAAIFQPAKFDREQVSVYLITPHEDPKYLEEHNYYSIPNTTVHEAYPGHHLQGCCANTNTSLIRLLTPFPVEFVEGWAHYCEEYMKEIGFDTSPEARFEQTADMVWRATRMILDIKLAKGEITHEEAVEYLIEQTGMERQIATVEVNEYAERPTYFLSYYLGKHMILKLRRDLMNKLGKNFDECKFHNVLLYSGSLPMRYIRRALEEAFNLKLDDNPL